MRSQFSIMRLPWNDGGMNPSSIGTARRWSMLVIALTATLCANVFINGVAFLIPTLHAERGLDLAEAGLMASLPSFGMVVTLIAWGWVVDRVGERFVLDARLGIDGRGGVRGGGGTFPGRRRRLSVPRWHGRREQQLGQRTAGGRLVSAASARPDDGHPSDGPAIGSRLGRVGDSPARRAQRSRRRATVSRHRVCRRRCDQCGRRARPAPPASRRGAAGTPGQSVSGRRRCGESMRSRCCWSCRSASSGRSPWSG